MRQNKSWLGKKLSGSGINSNGLPVVQLHLKPPPPTPLTKKRKEQKRMRYGDRGDRADWRHDLTDIKPKFLVNFWQKWVKSVKVKSYKNGLTELTGLTGRTETR